MNTVWSSLVNAALLSVPLAAAAGIVLRLISRRAINAATRYAIWWSVLAITITMPLFFPQGPANHRATATMPKGSVDLRLVEIQSDNWPAAQPAPPSATFHLPLEIRTGPWMRWLAAAWMALSTVLLLRLLLSHRAVRRAAGAAFDIPPEWSERARQWSGLAGAQRRGFRLAISPTIAIPVATGPFHPTILIPAALLEESNADLVAPIALHEAAHLARHDDCTLLLQRFLEAVLAPHPTVRWITRQIDLEREIACDDLAAQATGNPRHYAECLTRAMALCGSVRGTLAAAHATGRRSHLSRRVELLVEETRGADTRLFAARLSVFAAALTGAAVLLAHSPAPFTFATKPKEISMTQKIGRPMNQLVLAAAAAAAIVTQPAAAQLPSPIADSRPAQAQAAKMHRNLVLFFDNSGFTQADQAKALAFGANFVQNKLQTDDVVAIMVSGADGIIVRQDFTADRDVLLKEIHKIADLPAGQISETASAAATDQEGDRQLNDVQRTFQMLGALPDKKLLIYLAKGFATISDTNHRIQLEAAINAAKGANVAVYSIDVQAMPAK
jgi:beta-lactamase regulating signal transducer with metallopeptidase domain